MGLFGGGNSSSSSTNLTTNNDNRNVADSGGSAVSGTGNNLTISDGGAVKAALGFAATSFSDLIGLARDTVKTTTDNAAASSGTIATAYDNAKGDGSLKVIVAIGALAAVAVVVFAAFRGH